MSYKEICELAFRGGSGKAKAISVLSISSFIYRKEKGR